jgi:hypothetical protein
MGAVDGKAAITNGGSSLRVRAHQLEAGGFEAIKWPENMAPSRSPIHLTNELEVAASPETIWSLLVDPKAWPSSHPCVEHVHLLHKGALLRVGKRLETNLAGQDLFASMQEFERFTHTAWGGLPKVAEDSKAHHAWIITSTATGSHLSTEETMRGSHWIELAKKAPDIFWRTHERLPADLAKVAIKREGSRREKPAIR